MSMIDGLISGLDTSGVINEMLAAQRAPAQRLEARQTKASSEATTIAAIRSLVDGVKAAARGVDTAGDWHAVKASSSDTAVATVSTRPGAQTGALSFTVDRVAAAHQLVSAGTPQAADVAWADADTIVVEVGGEMRSIAVTPNAETGVRDLTSVVSAVNAAGIGVRAQAVQVAPGQFRLQLEADDTGAASEFSVVGGLASAFAVARQGQDARIELAGGLYDATSPDNTFEQLVPGLDVTVRSASDEPVQVSVTSDPEALAAKVQSLVTAVDNVLKGVRDATKYDTERQSGSILTGDPTARRVAGELTRALLDGVEGSPVGAPGLAGISIDKDGAVSFDKERFLDAYEADPDGVEALFTSSEAGGNTITDRLVAAVDAATATGSGYLRTAEQRRVDQADALGEQITKIESRLEREALLLRKKFADMEAALGTLKQQGDWLAGQISSLQPAQK